ncbi:MAG: hypothetical protein CSA11_01165 [Chloroflexi bacterium]|nr:MAG: hypothetical protein CSB13_11605 [Chloroflexota bacterium]PIE82322.1 MAG: hypothetical protein CSA11_01165 [Chloroflexota bacterium]
MSDTILKEIIARAIKDEEFRNLLFTNLDKALVGYQVSDEDRKMLEGLDADNFDEFAGGLGDRTTKGFLPGTG